MAGPTPIQIKRTSVSGRAANSVTLPDPGSLAINMTDQIMYSTNGDVHFEIGANVDTQVVRTALYVGDNVDLTTAGLFVGNTLVNVSINSTTFSGIANNALYLGGVLASSYALDADLDAYQTEAGLAANVAVLAANNASFLGGLSAANYANLSVATFTVSVNIGSNIKANTIGIYPASNTVGQNLGNTIARWTGLFNSWDVGGPSAGQGANSIGLYPASNTVGQLFGNTISRWEIFANSINMTGILTANGGTGTATQVLTSNSLGGTYWAAGGGGGGTPGGSNTHIQYNDSTAFNGSAAFTFDEATNTVGIVETGSIFAGNSTVNNTITPASMKINISATANLTSNSTIVQVANSTGTSNLTPTSLAIGSTLIANSLGLYPASNTVGDSFGNTIARWDGFFNNEGLTVGTPDVTGTNGYTYLTNGIILQWGMLVCNTTSTATFSIPFPTSCLSVSATSGPTGTVHIGANTIRLATVNTTVAQIRSTSTTTSNTAMYIAVGF